MFVLLLWLNLCTLWHLSCNKTANTLRIDVQVPPLFPSSLSRYDPPEYDSYLPDYEAFRCGNPTFQKFPCGESSETMISSRCL